MQIHVVSSGETLFSIARQYDVPAGILARYNGLAEPYRLAVGQSLLILRPTSLVTVRAGDTLSSLARQNGQSVRSLLRLNPNLTQQTAIYPGQIVVTAIEDAPERTAAAFGYAYPYVSPSVLAGILPYAGGVAPFTYGFTEDGTLVPLDDTALLAQAAEIGTAGVMHLSTLTERGTFSAERAAALLENEAAQETLIANVVTNMAARGYQALDVDFEYLGAPLAAAYAAFLGKLRAAVNASGWPLLAALAPKTSREQAGTLYEGHDYAAVAANTDAVLLMTYEWGYTYGPPMAAAIGTAGRRICTDRDAAGENFPRLSELRLRLDAPLRAGDDARAVDRERSRRAAGGERRRRDPLRRTGADTVVRVYGRRKPGARGLV